MSDTSIAPGTTIGTIRLTVADLDRSLAFYQEALGWRIVEQQEGHATLSASDRAPAQIILTEQRGARPKPARASGLYHFALLHPSRRALARTLQRLASLRVPIQGASDHLVSEAIYLADPDSHGIEIYADRPREQWPHRNGRLQMDTIPLDLENLLAELRGDDQPWTGTDPGTHIGHIHLHTASLDRAAAFYRDLLGFEEMMRYGASALFLAAGGYHHHIGLNTWAGVGAPPPPPSSVRLQAVSFALPAAADVTAVAERVQREQPDKLRSLVDSGNRIELLLEGPDEVGVILEARQEAEAREPRQIDIVEWLAAEGRS